MNYFQDNFHFHIYIYLPIFNLFLKLSLAWTAIKSGWTNIDFKNKGLKLK